MAAGSNSVWAIDLGNSALKALRLSDVGGIVEVVGFDHIRHDKILVGSGVKDAERDELIAISLRQFIKQNDLGRDEVVVSVPSQNSFARFVNLPPVEKKRIPEIVKFEAAQQIPFDINDVQWDWQPMSETGSAESKVGIFAVKNDVVNSMLSYFTAEDLPVTCIQMAPMALYNYACYDMLAAAGGVDAVNRGIVIMDIGAENTDLVVCTPSAVWQRCIPMGGNAFTRAIAEAFRLSFEKAEKLKCTAAVSKYARQLLQAMKPIFTDLGSEVQRSLNYFASSNPDVKLTKVIAFGGGTKLRGLLKYFQQTLQMPVERPDAFKRLAMAEGVSAAKFHESTGDFGIVYGLALQGLGLGRIESNLLPRSIARSMVWAGKARYFTAAACMLLAVSLMCFGRVWFDRASYQHAQDVRGKIDQLITSAKQAENKVQQQKQQGKNYRAAIDKQYKYFDHRDVLPSVTYMILSSLPNEKNNQDQAALYEAFRNGDVETVMAVPRKKREQIFITRMAAMFVDDLEIAQFSEMDFLIQTGAKGGMEEEEEEEGSYNEEWGYMKGTGGRRGQGSRFMPPRMGGAAAAVADKKPGFMVTIAGYSPCEKVGRLIDPVGVEGDRAKWGFVTRLAHFDRLRGEQCPFELYKRNEKDHFKLDIGAVDSSDARMPVGIGMGGAGSESAPYPAVGLQRILVDPMTKETISKVPLLDAEGKRKIDRFGKALFEVNDHWFVLNLKLLWKEAPQERAPAAGGS